MAFTAVFDGSVLESSATRDILLRLAQTGIFRGRWTEKTLEEMEHALVAQQPNLASRLGHLRVLMRQAVPDCMVTDYEDLMGAVKPPDLGGHHVIAAAVRCGAQVIVTGKSDRFPDEAIGKYGIEAQSADQFVSHLISLEPSTVVQAVRQRVGALANPPSGTDEYLNALERDCLFETVLALRHHMGG